MKFTFRWIPAFLLLSILSACAASQQSLPTPTADTRVWFVHTNAGFELAFPAGWIADEPIDDGNGGSFAMLTSWEREPGSLVLETPPGESSFVITVISGTPAEDLEAYVAQRMATWESFGQTPAAHEEWLLEGDLPAVFFLFEIEDQDFTYLITSLGDQYLVISGSGDLDQMRSIASSLRKIPAN